MSKYKITCLAVVLLILSAAALHAFANEGRSQSRQGKSPGVSPDDPQYLLRTRGYAKALPLAQAVGEFNRRARLTRIGKAQPPLRVEEVLAAIRDWNPEEDSIEPSMFEELQRAAKAGQMPKGAYLSFNSGSLSRNGYDIDAWNIYLRVGLDKYPDDLVGVPAYMVPIRRQYIASRPEEFLKKRGRQGQSRVTRKPRSGNDTRPTRGGRNFHQVRERGDSRR